MNRAAALGTSLRILRRTLLVLVAIPLLYVIALVVLGLIPANWGWREADRGVTIFVNTNGVHTGIAVPLSNGVMDWRPLVPAEDLRVPVRGNYIVIGYGHRGFYLETPSWADLTASTAASALLGLGSTVIHIDHVQDPQEDGEQRALTLSPEEYRRLVAFILPHFQRDAAGRTVPVRGRGYWDNDAFYEANGRYDAILTCNEWTGRALRAAGVRMGLWTPVEQSIMWRLP